MEYEIFDVPVEVSSIINALHSSPSLNVVVRFKNTITLTQSKIDMLKRINPDRIKIQIVGGYDEKRIKDYPRYEYIHTTDNIYTLDEAKKILAVIEEIERGLNPEWDESQKLFYFIGYLKNHISYHPFFELQPSPEIRSLRGLISKQTVCAGYALILKELCDRHGIECQYVEGCTNTTMLKKGYLTHAWNIVKIKGKNIPIDLTWSAGKLKRGEMLSTSDIGNATQFVKKHIPGLHEELQDYEHTLTSIDGSLARNMSSMYSRDKEVSNQTYIGEREDGTRYVLIQTGQKVQDNQYVYSYIFQEVVDRKLSPPVILYTTTNINGEVAAYKRKHKLQKQLEQAMFARRDDIEEEIRKELAEYEDMDNIKYLIDNVLFSRENIKQSLIRRDFFVGEIYPKENGEYAVKVDLEFAKKNEEKQKTYKRNDGTSFVAQGCIKKGRFYQSKINETVLTDTGLVLLQNTIFTDYDFIEDTRGFVGDVFLSRKRLDEECKENNGYLGYIDRLGNIYLKTKNLEVFRKHIYDRYKIKDEHFREYVSDLTFDEIKRLIRTYEPTYGDGRVLYRSKVSKKIVRDKTLELKIKFSYIWLQVAGTKRYTRGSSDSMDPNYYFGSNARDTYERIYEYINNSMLKDGNVDPIAILDAAEKFHFKHIEEIILKMFKNKEDAIAINKLFRVINPSVFDEKTNITYFGCYSDNYPYEIVSRRREHDLEKMMLDVSQDESGKVVITETKNKYLR